MSEWGGGEAWEVGGREGEWRALACRGYTMAHCFKKVDEDSVLACAPKQPASPKTTACPAPALKHDLQPSITHCSSHNTMAALI